MRWRKALRPHYNPDKPKQMLIVGYNTKSTIYLCMAVMAMGVVVPFFLNDIDLEKTVIF